MTIDEEVGQNPTGTPGYPIRPPFDARSSLLVDEHIPADDQLIAFAIVRTTETVSEGSFETRFENEQGVLRGLNMPSPCWCTCRSFSCVHGKLIRVEDGLVDSRPLESNRMVNNNI